MLFHSSSLLSHPLGKQSQKFTFRKAMLVQFSTLLNAAYIVLSKTIVMSLICSNRLDSTWGDGSIWRPERWFEPLPPKEQLVGGWGNLSKPSNMRGTNPRQHLS